MPELPRYFDLTGQVAVITGAASGIGESAGQVLASAGASVALGDIDEDGVGRVTAKIAADGGRAVGVRADVSSRADVDMLVDRAVSEFGRLDIMCNMAGIGNLTPVEEIDDDKYDRLMSLNVKSVIYGCQAALRAMKPRRSGSIINAASTAIDRSKPGLALYGMSKVSVTYLSQVLSVEAGPDGIRVNVIAPGPTETNFTTYRYPDGKLTPERRAEYADRMTKEIPLGTLGEAIDQSLLVLYLASPASRWATGNIWRCNGGQSRPW
jgi:3-oxoacyl-[acyl-carrier protein] reductase